MVRDGEDHTNLLVDVALLSFPMNAFRNRLAPLFTKREQTFDEAAVSMYYEN